MPIEFNCQSCSKLLRVPDGSGGKQCQCPSCSALLNIPLPHAPAGVALTGLANSSESPGALCIPCPKCKHELICDPSLIGTKGQCRSCKHIFVITDVPPDASQPASPSVNWVFSCPSCNQLFEGSEEMRGRRGKCHSCSKVFSIELRDAAETPSELIESPNAANSFEGELTLDAAVDVRPAPRASSAQPKSMPASRAASPAAAPKSARAPLPPIQFNCSHCKGRLEVPGVAARQLTHCPHCQRQLTIPAESEPTADALAASDPWADLGPLGGAAAAQPSAGPFGDTLYTQPLPLSPMLAGPRKRSSGTGGHFVVCGIFVALCAVCAIIIEIVQIVVYAMVIAALSNMNDPRMIQAAVTLAVLFAMLVLSIIQLLGGIALARRQGLGLARAGVVICCLPCLCILNIPFGVWGCFLVFKRDAARAFR